MRSASFDRRVKKEAGELVKEARAALRIKKSLKGKAGDLETATTAVEKALRAKDLAAVRDGLPTLDAIVDELLQRPRKSTMRNYVESIGGAILIALALRAFVVEAFKIPTSSMYPTLEINDHIFVNKFLYGLRIPWTDTKLFEWRAPHRGEVIVFDQPCEKRDYIKRIIAVAGDTVEVRCDVVYVNGKAIEQTPIQPAYPGCLETNNCCTHDEDEGSGWIEKPCTRWRETVDGLAYDTYQPEERPSDHQVWGVGDNDFPDKIPPSCATPARDDRPPSKRCDQIDPATRPFPPCSVDDQQQGRVEVFGEGISKARGFTQPTDVPEQCQLSRYYVVPEGHVFCMGDNRANSNDSRVWGSVPISHIKGKALFLWFSYKDFPGSIRWSRIGNFVH